MPRFASHALNSLNVKIVYFPSPVRFRNTGTWSGNDVMKRGETTKIKKKILLKQIEIKINSVLVIYFYCFSRRCDDCMTLLRGKKKPQNARILKNREKYAKPFRTFRFSNLLRSSNHSAYLNSLVPLPQNKSDIFKYQAEVLRCSHSHQLESQIVILKLCYFSSMSELNENSQRDI